jgi:hypothetical protein
MNVRQLITNLMTMDMDAEVMVDTPVSSTYPFLDSPAHLTIPVRSISTGHFGSGNMEGKSWVSVNGTSVWGQNQGVDKT